MYFYKNDWIGAFALVNYRLERSLRTPFCPVYCLILKARLCAQHIIGAQEVCLTKLFISTVQG